MTTETLASLAPRAGSTAAGTRPVTGLPDPGEQVPALAWPTAGLYAATLLLLGVEMVGIFALGWSPWVTVPMGVAVTFLMFSVLHEATHHAVSTDTRLNDAFGHLAVPFVAPYATFPMIKFIHIEHHRNTNEPKDVDPDAWTSEGPWWQLPFRWATIDLWYLVFYLRRAPSRPRVEVALTVTVFVGVVAGLAGLAVAGYGAELAVAVLVPQRIGLMVLAWWFDYLPHHGLTATQREDRYRATRVRVGGERWLTPLFVYQNYHLVHHLHPSVPFYRYIRAWRRNEEAYLDRNAAISTWFGRSLSPEEYRTWRRLTDDLGDAPRSGPRFHALRVRALEPLTADSVAVTFDVPDDLKEAYRYVQGQHVTLRAVVDGEDVRRSYSITEPVSSQRLRVAVRLLEGGVFSTYVHRQLRPGDILDVMTPTGRFHTPLDPGAARHHVAVAAGSGITPVMSVLRTTLEAEPESTFTLVYGNRTPGSTMFREELDDLARCSQGRLVVHHVLSREAAPHAETGARRHPGRITPALLRDLAPEPDDVHAWFLCGPQAMVEDLTAALAEAGVDSGRVVTELFHVDHPTAPTMAEPADAVPTVDSEVTVVLDGASTQVPVRAGGTVLDSALAAGVDAPYSCAGGACGTCRARVVEGEAVMEQNHYLDDEEVADGYVLTCQAQPVTDRVRVDYDG